MFTNNEIGQMQLFKDGFFQGLADLPLTRPPPPTMIPLPRQCQRKSCILLLEHRKILIVQHNGHIKLGYHNMI